MLADPREDFLSRIVHAISGFFQRLWAALNGTAQASHAPAVGPASRSAPPAPSNRGEMREQVVSRLAEALADDDIAGMMTRTHGRALGTVLQDTVLLRRRSSSELEAEGRRMAIQGVEALSPDDRAKIDEVRRLVREGGFTAEESEELFAQSLFEQPSAARPHRLPR